MQTIVQGTFEELPKDPTYSDSILDRLVRNAFRINMNGESMRGQTRYGAVPVEENTEK